MSSVIEQIATVFNNVDFRQDENWKNVISSIVLDEKFNEDSLHGLKDFSHIEVLFGFHLLNTDEVETEKRSPRNNPDYPRTGIFAQRASKRPNLLGISIVKIFDVFERTIKVSGLDAINGSPVFDLKPVIREFIPERNEIIQPEWATDIMKNYF